MHEPPELSLWVLEHVLLGSDDLIRLVRLVLAKATLGRANPLEVPHPLEAQAYRLRLAEWEDFVARFKAMKASAASTDRNEREFGRRALIVEFRRLIDGVVLHANRVLTIHMAADGGVCRVVCALDRNGLSGVQLKMPEGATGFIERSVIEVLRGGNCSDASKMVTEPRKLAYSTICSIGFKSSIQRAVTGRPWSPTPCRWPKW
jgi:hypothetical protein